MLSSLLRSDCTIKMHVNIMRAFARLDQRRQYRHWKTTSSALVMEVRSSAQRLWPASVRCTESSHGLSAGEDVHAEVDLCNHQYRKKSANKCCPRSESAGLWRVNSCTIGLDPLP